MRPRKTKDYVSPKNVTLDGDVLKVLHDVQEKLKHTLGFKPTLSDTIRHLAHRTKKELG